ncbi:MAG: hypothetical protein IJS28_00975, partial [Synergistaceae bacterium]|nr:hypothetical protein [Synergistaceae bacterium]
MNSILNYETVSLDDKDNSLVILDQTRLPNEIITLHLKTQPEVWHAIRTLQVRGAPAIGIAAAFGLYLAAKDIRTDNHAEFMTRLHEAKEYLNSSRP